MSLKFRVFSAVSILLLVVSIGFNIAQALPENTAEPGSDQDPVVSKSYVDQSVGQLNQLLQNMQSQLNQLQQNMQGQLDQMKTDNAGLTQRVTAQDALIKALQDELKNVKAQTPASSVSTQTGTAAGTLKGTVNIAIVNLRSQANTTSSILAKLAKGETVTIVTKGAEWYRIKTSKGVTGYVLGKYITVK